MCSNACCSICYEQHVRFKQLPGLCALAPAALSGAHTYTCRLCRTYPEREEGRAVSACDIDDVAARVLLQKLIGHGDVLLALQVRGVGVLAAQGGLGGAWQG